jgi:uncharacterized protein (DUF1919 family)
MVTNRPTSTCVQFSLFFLQFPLFHLLNLFGLSQISFSLYKTHWVNWKEATQTWNNKRKTIDYFNVHVHFVLEQTFRNSVTHAMVQPSKNKLILESLKNSIHQRCGGK